MKRIAICGASGLVGKEIINCLESLDCQVKELVCYASARSAGKTIPTNKFGTLKVKEFELNDCKEFDIVFLCINGDFSLKYAKDLVKSNNLVIDSSSAFRYDKDIPLIIPEINGHLISESKLIANPNCTTAILSMALYPIYKNYGLKKVFVSTYQATSGSGKAAMTELLEETKNYLDNTKVGSKEFAHPIPFNLIPAIDSFQENSYTKEEMKVVWETRKIFGDEGLKISCTAVRVPLLRVHAESVVVETEKKVEIKEVRQILKDSSGVTLVDEPSQNKYPMPINAEGKFEVEVGRLRRNLIFEDYGLELFICGDQLLKGAALNAVQIAQLTI